MPEPKFLERFFRNMLLGEQWDLRNRYLVINPPAEYAEQPRLDTPTSTINTPASTPTSSTSTPTSSQDTEPVPPQVSGDMFHTDNKNIRKIVNILGQESLSIKEMMNAVGLKDRKNFIEYSLTPAISTGFVRMLYPDSPRHPKQKYLLTVKGIGLYNQLYNQLHNHPECIPNK